jgi:hypothetical protein
MSFCVLNSDKTHSIDSFSEGANSCHSLIILIATMNCVRSKTRLNLGGMAAVFADLALKAAKEGLPHEAYLFKLAKQEEDQRSQRRTMRLLRASGLPADKTFRNFDLESRVRRNAPARFGKGATEKVREEPRWCLTSFARGYVRPGNGRPALLYIVPFF